jgi:hypothetical protein
MIKNFRNSQRIDSSTNYDYSFFIGLWVGVIILSVLFRITFFVPPGFKTYFLIFGTLTAFSIGYFSNYKIRSSTGNTLLGERANNLFHFLIIISISLSVFAYGLGYYLNPYKGRQLRCLKSGIFIQNMGLNME